MCAPENKDVGIERFTNDGWCHGNTTFMISVQTVVYGNFIRSQNLNWVYYLRKE